MKKYIQPCIAFGAAMPLYTVGLVHLRIAQMLTHL